MDPNPNPNPNPSPTQVDHSVTSGPRYTISYEHGAIVPPLVRAGRRRLCAYLASRPNASNATARRQFSPCARADYGVPLPPPPPPPPPPSPSPPPSPPPPLLLLLL